MSSNADVHPTGSAAFAVPYRKQWATLHHIVFQEGRAKSLFGIERVFLAFVCAALLVMPAMPVRGLGQMFGEHGRRIAMELYAIGKPLLLLAVLFSGHFASALWMGWAAISLVDLYLSLFAMVFLQHFHTGRTSHGRSLLLLMVNFAESAIAYAVLYGALHTVAHQSQLGAPPTSDPFDLLYFSCVTAASVGYGDFLPVTTPGKLLSLVQILSSMGFIFIFLTSFVANFNEREPV